MAIPTRQFRNLGGGAKERETPCGCGYRTQRYSSFTNLETAPPTITRGCSSTLDLTESKSVHAGITRRASDVIKPRLGPGCLGIAVLGTKLEPNERKKSNGSKVQDDAQYIKSVQDATIDYLARWSFIDGEETDNLMPRAPCSSPVLQDDFRLIYVDTADQEYGQDVLVETELSDQTQTSPKRCKKHLQFMIPVGNELDSELESEEPGIRKRVPVKPILKNNSKISSFSSSKNDGGDRDKEEGNDHINSETKREKIGSKSKYLTTNEHTLEPKERAKSAAPSAVKCRNIEFLTGEEMEYPNNQVSDKILETLLFLESIQDKNRSSKPTNKAEEIGAEISEDSRPVREDTERKRTERDVKHPPEFIVNKKNPLPRPVSEYQIREKHRGSRPSSGKRSEIRKGYSDQTLHPSRRRTQVHDSDEEREITKVTENNKRSEDLTTELMVEEKDQETVPFIWEKIAGIDDKSNNVVNSKTVEELEHNFPEMVIADDHIIVDAVDQRTTPVAEEATAGTSSTNFEEKEHLLDSTGSTSNKKSNEESKVVTFADEEIVSRVDSTNSKADVNLRPTARVRKMYREQKKQLENMGSKASSSKSRMRPKSSHPRIETATPLSTLKIDTTKQSPIRHPQIAWESSPQAGLNQHGTGARPKSAKLATGITSRSMVDQKSSAKKERPKTARSTKSKSATLSRDTGQSKTKGSGKLKKRPISAPVGKIATDHRLMAEDMPSQECEHVFTKCQELGLQLSMKTLCRALMPPSEDHRKESYTRLPKTTTGLLQRPGTWFR